MKLPKKIDCPNLKETIVEVRLIANPGKERDLWAGILASAFKEMGYAYNRIPRLNLAKEGENVFKITIDRDSSALSINLFVNVETGIRFIINDNTVSFNCEKGRYVGWDKYREAIFEVISKFQESGIALSFERVMIRYISEYDIDILDKVNIEVKSGDANGYSPLDISLVKKVENINAYVNISGLRERTSRTTDEKRVSSLFDVSVYERLGENSTPEDVRSSLDKIHAVEKESFFGMLREDFVKTLNPRY